MKVFAIIVTALVSSATTQEILEVVCGSNAIIARFSKQVADAVNYNMEDLRFNDFECGFDEEKDGYYIKTIDLHTMPCGTQVVTNDTHILVINTISSVPPSDIFPHGIIVGSQNKNIISVKFECAYELGLDVTFVPNMTEPNVKGSRQSDSHFFSGNTWKKKFFDSILMDIYKTAAYREIYAYGPPLLYADDTVYLGITMSNYSSDLFILIRGCWATVEGDQRNVSYYDLIINSCPVKGAVNGTVKMIQNGIGHQALWQTQVFRFVGGEEEFVLTHIHCDLSICAGKSCPVDCSGRRRRKRRIRSGRSIDVMTKSMTVRFQIKKRVNGSVNVISVNGTDHADKTTREREPHLWTRDDKDRKNE